MLNEDQLRIAEFVVWLILMAFWAATAVADPAVTNCDGPVAPQVPGTQGTGSAGPAAFAPLQTAEAHSATAADCISGSRCLPGPGGFFIICEPSS
jgi:hypothetical protein